MKVFRKAGIVSLAALLLATGCRKKNDDSSSAGGAPPPTYNAGGTWNVLLTRTAAKAGCGDVGESLVSAATVAQSGTTVTATFHLTGVTYSGSVSGADYTLSATYAITGGTETDNVKFTLTSMSSGSGTINWSTSLGCTGETALALTKT
jgi:hypothetical protein